MQKNGFTFIYFLLCVYDSVKKMVDESIIFLASVVLYETHKQVT